MQSQHHEPSGWARGKSPCQSFRRSPPQRRTTHQVRVPNLGALLGLFSAFFSWILGSGMSLRCDVKFVNGAQGTQTGSEQVSCRLSSSCGCDSFWLVGRQTLPYRIMEGLPVTRLELSEAPCGFVRTRIA